MPDFFGDSLLGPSSEHATRSSTTLQILHAVQHFLQSKLEIANSGCQKLCKEIMAIVFLTKFCKKIHHCKNLKMSFELSSGLPC